MEGARVFLGAPRKCDLSKCKPQMQDRGLPSKYVIVFLHVIDGKETKQNKQKKQQENKLKEYLGCRIGRKGELVFRNISYEFGFKNGHLHFCLCCFNVVLICIYW